MSPTSNLLELLHQRVVLFDGANGTQIQAADLGVDDYDLPPAGASETATRLAAETRGSLEGCVEALNLSRPDVIAEIHRGYLKAGSDVVTTNTFGTSAIVLGEYGLQELDYELSFAGARIARSVADEFENRFVAGGLGPGTRLLSLGQTDWDTVRSTYQNAAQGLIDGGADFLLLETMQDLLTTKAIIVAAIDATEASGKSLPIFVQVTIEQNGAMLLGSEPQCAIVTCEAFPEVTAFGINCATGPEGMRAHVRTLVQNSTRPILTQPNAGMPEVRDGATYYPMGPSEFAVEVSEFVSEVGVAMVGGCCGTNPDHIAALSDRLGDRRHRSEGPWRSVFTGFDFTLDSEQKASAAPLRGVASLYQYAPYDQAPSFFIVGERTNANGSRLFKKALAEEDWETIVEIARELEQEGSHAIDLCVAYVGRNEVRDMQEASFRLNTAVTVPVMIDSTETPVIETALQRLAGKPIVNSINFEDGERKADDVLGLCRRYGAAIVGLTIDETGMAKSVDHKMQIVDRLVGKTRSFGIPDHDLFIDALTFTLGSGDEEFRNAGIDTIEAIRQIHARYPMVQTILGVSNISFGLKPAARAVLNSVFLEEARKAGLTAGIVHYSKLVQEASVDPEIWKIAADLVYDRRRFESA